MNQFEIRNNRGRIEIIGNFTAEYSNAVYEYINYLLDHYEEVVMCLRKVRQMDKKAAEVLSKIYDKAQRRSKVLFVFGKHNSKVKNAFENHNIIHIFRNDY